MQGAIIGSATHGSRDGALEPESQWKKRGPESWELFQIREGDLPVSLSVLYWGEGGFPK